MAARPRTPPPALLALLPKPPAPLPRVPPWATHKKPLTGFSVVHQFITTHLQNTGKLIVPHTFAPALLKHPPLGLPGCGSKPMVPFWGGCTTHFSLFEWGLGCSLGLRDFDPWPPFKDAADGRNSPTGYQLVHDFVHPHAQASSSGSSTATSAWRARAKQHVVATYMEHTSELCLKASNRSFFSELGSFSPGFCNPTF